MAQPKFDLEHHIFFWLTQVMGARDRRLSQELGKFGLRVPEYRVLASLYARPGRSMSELSDLASIDRTTLTRTVDRMGETGWVIRVNDTRDMRVTRLKLAAAGERLFTRIWPSVEAVNQSALEGLPQPVADMLRWTLSEIKINLDKEPLSAQRVA